jgi:hypothetical protein
MRTADTIELVRRVNPVPNEPGVPPVASLLELLDPSLRTATRLPRQASTRARRNHRARRAMPALAGSVALALLVVAILGRPGNQQSFDVAAAFYRATTPGSGVLHMVTETETRSGAHTRRSRDEIYSAQNPRRFHSIIRLGGETFEGSILSVNPPKTLSWSTAQPGLIRESLAKVGAVEQTPVDLLREAYRQGRLHLVGRSALNGRSVWRLEVLTTPQTLGGRKLPLPTILIDAHTFVPLENIVNAAAGTPHHRELIKTTVRYLTYQELPSTPASRGLLDLAAHAGARIVTEPVPPGER